MSEIESGGGEISSSSEVSETSVAETGGESSEATQEAVTEEAGESGGFDEDADTTESPEDIAEDYEESDYDGELDDSQEVGFSEGDDIENFDSQDVYTDNETGDVYSGDEDGVGFDDTDDNISEETEGYDIETEAYDSTMDADGDADESFDTPNDYGEDPSESNWDDQEAEDVGEFEDYSDEETLEDSTENGDGINDIQDDDEIDDTESFTNVDDIDGDAYSGSEPNDVEYDAESDTEIGDDIDDDLDAQEDEDVGELEDYSDDEGFDNSAEDNDDIDDAQDDGDVETDDTDASVGENETETDAESDIDDLEDNGETETDDIDSSIGDEEADGDMDNDGELDDAESDAEDDIDDVQDDGEAEIDDGEADIDDDEANIEDDDYDEDEDPGELEDYSDEYTDNLNQDAIITDDSESEREETEEEQAAEDDKEAADRAEDETENVDIEKADKNVDDAADSEKMNSSESVAEQQNESAETEDNNEVDIENDTSKIGENNNNETQDDAVDNKVDNSTDAGERGEEQPDDIENKAETPEGEDAYRTAMNNMAEYMNEHNYGRDDYAEYSQDPEWQELNAALQKAQGIESESTSIDTPSHDEALVNMSNYMNEHNYGSDDYAEYSQDPEWQKLNADLQQSSAMEAATDVSTPLPESVKDVELPDNCVMVNASDIDMTYAQGMDSDQFWNHHGNTKEDYINVAERIPDVQQALDSGKSLDEIKQDPELRDTAHAYFDPENMIKVEQQSDGSYSFVDDGRHRIAAAQELGYEIPVEVTNMPESTNASTADNADLTPEDTAALEDVANKSDISSETRENLGAFEQNNWDNLSQVEKEQAVEKLRDSIAEDLQLENKPNIAYYSNEDHGDYGGYAASTNTIYINRFNMGNAAETADTIAHASRHCWQHERADNPETEQDYQFKINFEDYVRPEDDFYEYQNQPVEADARDYAQGVKDAIPVSDEPPDMEEKQSYEGNEHKSNNDAPPSTTGPPEKTYQKSELPADFENKKGYQPLNEQAEQKCQLAGMEKDQVQKIREIPNGQKPNPEDYLSKDTIESHLKKFEDEGCYKVIPGEPVGTVGKGDSLFVCRGSELEQALVEADGDPRKLEKALGMDDGYLGDNPYIVRVDNPKDLRMATGNETNAWQDYWCPGGTTIGGMDEAVVTPPNSDDYSFKPCFENGNSTSIYDENWKKH